ncbi:non-ribosomal peptide synthetase [Aquimarina intermedia]|uniref:Amino acid adenylation domain-containing protein n=1 Tax=Aquimarina intermedia TaxID=350814 RepID=A0A5S5C4K1_9FLAO|nr:non-ribosomal peptide synthetase [Aquimarina intermedia]TYP74355.1 amino acid adenylation domain-containing protein [Aquimarina intermedia]
MIFQKELLESLKRFKDNVAIHDKEEISYSQLLTQSLKIASFIKSKGIEEQSYIGVSVSHKSSIIKAAIGIFLSRNIFVPIDTELPIDRKKKILEKAEINTIITSKNDKPLQIKTNNHFYIEDIFSEAFSESNISFPKWRSEDDIYLYFTSGSTGEPKGIIGKNESLLQFLKWEINAFSFEPAARFSQFISPYFDAFLRDVFAPLLSGGTICIPQEDAFYTSDQMIPWIEKMAINYIHCVPSVFKLFNTADITSTHFKSLHYVFLSGERIIPSELENWFNKFNTDIRLVNFYGATETTMIRSCYHLKPSDVSKMRIPIGKPIDDTHFQVLNEQMNICGPLVPGELYIATKYLTNGYLKDEVLQAEKFVNLTINDETFTAFKTGDTVKKLIDGNFDLLGRTDRQIKLRGIRIELAEIENAIISHPTVKEALVIPNIEDEKKTIESLEAFIVLKKASKDIQSDFKETFLHTKLPSYMIPSQIHVLDEFPLLENGKTDVQKLLKHRNTEVSSSKAPSNDIEKLLHDIWTDILGVQAISIDANFLKVGGNSISLMRLIGVIYKKFNVRIALSEIFNNLTIEEQAIKICSLQKEDVLKLTKSDTKKLYPLTTNQERIFYQYETNKEDVSYNLPLAWEISEEVSIQKMEDIFKQLIARHEAFRTSFTYQENVLWQKISDDVPFQIEEIFTQGTDQHITEAINVFISPFNLSKSPLLRVAVINAEGFKNVLVLDTHHIICDGMSQIILLKEFVACYNDSKLPPLEFRFRDYSEWENQFRKTEEYVNTKNFWHTMLGNDIPKLQLPVNFKVENLSNSGGSSFTFYIEKHKIDTIVQSFSEKNITPFSVLYSIYHLFLFKLTGQRDIIIGINTLGRIQNELLAMIGMFSKTLPIRFNSDKNSSYSEILPELHNILLQSSENQIYDLSHIKKNLLQNTSQNIADELFDTMFVFQNFDFSVIENSEMDFRSYSLDNETSKYPLSLFATEESEKFCFRFEYYTALFTEEDMKLLGSQFVQLVHTIAENIDVKISNLLQDEDMLNEVEKDEISFNF